jgi:hypothetical protein
VGVHSRPISWGNDPGAESGGPNHWILSIRVIVARADKADRPVGAVVPRSVVALLYFPS